MKFKTMGTPQPMLLNGELNYNYFRDRVPEFPLVIQLGHFDYTTGTRSFTITLRKKEVAAWFSQLLRVLNTADITRWYKLQGHYQEDCDMFFIEGFCYYLHHSLRNRLPVAQHAVVSNLKQSYPTYKHYSGNTIYPILLGTLWFLDTDNPVELIRVKAAQAEREYYRDMTRRWIGRARKARIALVHNWINTLQEETTIVFSSHAQPLPTIEEIQP